jgi:hypothetical protein
MHELRITWIKRKIIPFVIVLLCYFLIIHAQEVDVPFGRTLCQEDYEIFLVDSTTCSSLFVLFYFPWDSLIDELKPEWNKLVEHYTAHKEKDEGVVGNVSPLNSMFGEIPKRLNQNDKVCLFSVDLFEAKSWAFQRFQVEVSPVLMLIKKKHNVLETGNVELVEYNGGIWRFEYFKRFIDKHIYTCNKKHEIYEMNSKFIQEQLQWQNSSNGDEYLNIIFSRNRVETIEKNWSQIASIRDITSFLYLSLEGDALAENGKAQEEAKWNESISQAALKFVSSLPNPTFSNEKSRLLFDLIINSDKDILNEYFALLYNRKYNQIKVWAPILDIDIFTWLEEASTSITEVACFNFRKVVLDKPTVLLFLNYSNEEQNVELLNEFARLSIKYNPSLDQRKVNFVYMYGNKFDEFLKRVNYHNINYNIELPRIVIFESKKERHLVCVNRITKEDCLSGYYNNEKSMDEYKKQMDLFISSFKVRNNPQSNNLEYIATHFVRSEKISAFKHSTLNNYIYTSYDSIQYLFEENYIHGSIRMCLLYLFAEQGCGYCHKMNLIFQRVAKQLDYIDYLVFAQLNVDNNDIPPLISRQYQIDTIPSILMLKKENSIWKCVDKYNGTSDTESLNVWIQSKLLHSVKIEPGATFI